MITDRTINQFLLKTYILPAFTLVPSTRSITYLKVSAPLEKPCASIFVWTASYYGHIHRAAIYTYVWLANKTMCHIKYPIRMESSFYFLQKMGIPHKSPVRLIADPIMYCFVIVVINIINIRPANEQNLNSLSDNMCNDRIIWELTRQYVQHLFL